MASAAPAHVHAGVSNHAAISNGRWGLWLFILSESFLFSAFLAARYYMLGFYRPEELNQALGLAVTSVLLLSSLTAYRAETSISYGDRPRFLRNTLATILLAGRYGSDNYWPVEGVVRYWHFVDVAWVFIYPTLYLVAS